MKKVTLVIAIMAMGAASVVYAATIKPGSVCKGISTSSGYKYVATYCVDFSCTETVRLQFDSYCPYQVDY